jgi:hypothetical protein
MVPDFWSLPKVPGSSWAWAALAPMAKHSKLAINFENVMVCSGKSRRWRRGD